MLTALAAKEAPKTEAATRSSFLRELIKQRSELSALENGTVKAIEKLFIRIGIEAGQIIKSEYDDKLAKTNPVALGKKLQRLIDKRIDELIREFQKQFGRDLEESNKLGTASFDSMLAVFGEKIGK